MDVMPVSDSCQRVYRRIVAVTASSTTPAVGTAVLATVTVMPLTAAHVLLSAES